MIKSLSFILLGVAAWVAIVAFTPSGNDDPGGKEPAEARLVSPRERKSIRREPVLETARSESGAEAGAPRREEAQQEIDTAAVTYSPEGVRKIRPWLLDEDPAIRAAALDGMIQLGEPDAVPLLRHAAAKLHDPAEIAAFHEAADLLALPAWSETAEAQEVIAEIIEGNSR